MEERRGRLQKFGKMKNKISTVQKTKKKTLNCSSSSSSSGSMQSPTFRKAKGKENATPYKKRPVYGAGKPKPKSARKIELSPNLVTTRSRKRQLYIIYDESSDDDIKRTSNKVNTLRRGLKISSAAGKRFEKELPWQLTVPLTDSTAFSKCNRKTFYDGEAAAVHHNDNDRDIMEIKMHLKVHDQKFEEIKEMLQDIVGRNLVRERVHKKMDSVEPSRPSDCQVLSQSVWSPLVKSRGISSKKLVGAISPRRHSIDPHELVDAADFMNWRRKVASGEGAISLRLPSEVVRSGDYDWFTELYDEEISLRDEHMDVLINLLVVKFEQEMGASARNFYVLETWAWGGLIQGNYKLCDDDLMPYVRGSYPLERGRAWHTVEVVYGFGHVNDDHWVGFQISIKEQRITVVDSLRLGSKLAKYFTPMSLNLPQLCEKSGIWEKKAFSEPLHTPWEVVYADDCPIQAENDKTNCGILVIKALEAMARGNSFDTIRADHCAAYRLQYCVDLHAHAKVIDGDE